MIEIRPARLEDADALCDAHVHGWRVGYRGLFPDEFLDAPEFDAERRANWRRAIWLGQPRQMMFAGVLDGRVAAFGHVGAERIDGVPQELGRGEVWSFYAHPTAWGSGLAPALIRACHGWLREQGYAQAVLWVLHDNPRARAFYERAGWSWTGTTTMWAGPQSTTALREPVAELQYAIEL